MRKNWRSVGLMVLVLCLSVLWTTGCAKKAALKEEGMASQGQKAVTRAPAKMAPTGPESKSARDRAMEEQALRDKAAREAAEKAAREAAAKAAADRAKMEAQARAASILKELRIADIHFDFDKYNLKPEAQNVLKKSAPAYLKHREYKLVIEGNCDERGTAEYNLALGQKRADEAAKFLQDLGVEKGRIKTISYGEELPLDPGRNETAWAKNRRDHFAVFPPK